ncbi:MAG: HAMP domain-containing protein, partial [Nitrospinaceae bacterium]
MSYEASTNSPPPYIQPSEEQLKTKRRRTRSTIVSIFFILIGLTALENYFLQQKTTSSVATNIAVLTVFNIILILLFVLIVLITRHLVKLYNERKSQIIGSKFQTKLIIAFLILALVPSVLLFTVASKLFTYSIGSWFNLQVKQTLQQSMDVAREYYSHVETGALSQTKNIEGFIKREELYRQENRGRLASLIGQKVNEYGLGGLIIFDNNYKTVASSFNQKVAPEGIELDYKDLLQKSVEGEGVSEFMTSSKGNFLTVAVPLTEILEDKISVWGYIVTLTQVPWNTFLKIESIRNTYENYQQQSFLQLPVSASYYITFLMITLLILFSAIWLGFYMARAITIPIQQLAEGTRRIAEGDLDFKIGVRAKDEIGILVDSFNQMTHQLGESRVNVQRAHENLKTINIELERRRNYIETILVNIGAGVVSINKRGRITTFNKAAEKILDIPAKNIFGSTYKDFFDPSYHEPIREMIRQMNQQQKESLEEQIEIRVGDANLTLLV